MPPRPVPAPSELMLETREVLASVATGNVRPGPMVRPYELEGAHGLHRRLRQHVAICRRCASAKLDHSAVNACPLALALLALARKPA